MLIWQFTPVDPAGQLHLYILIPSIHVLLWRHGLLWHSSMLVWHLTSVYPAAQVQLYEPAVLWQVALLPQGSMFNEHSLISGLKHTQYVVSCSMVCLQQYFAYSHSIFLEPISSFCIPSRLNHTSPLYEPEYDKTGSGVKIWRRKKHFYCSLSLLCKVSWWIEVSNLGKTPPTPVVFSLLMLLCKLRNEMYCIYTC